ncbi:hypothetical protein WKW80_33135 [Variovorax humicola]|uniref:Uncharacterized protein n=1 Tax=Variovorax humicola TaxID=1769758 RepID=A0ABU8W9S9_9BURK
MHELVIRPDWAQQIGQVRASLTEDTNIIRWGNTFYRCCRSGAPVALRVVTPDRTVALSLEMRPNDLYITRVGLATEMGRYGSLTSELFVSAPKFEHAVRSLAAGSVHGDQAFGLRSLVVFCVAEALRFDSLAHDVGFALLSVNVAGGARAMPLGHWWPTVHAWGQACDAVWAELDVDLRRASLLPAALRKGQDRTRSARATYSRMSADLLNAARGAAVLKLP